jgi:peptide/nickel transport system substrate-binding protein
MLSLRYILRLVRAFVARFRSVIFLSIGAGVALFFIVRILAPIIIPGRAETIGLVGKYHLETLPSEILLMIGGGLTKLDENGVVLPNLADSWETTDKGQTWIFHLRQDVLWQDGKKVTSSSIVYNFSDAQIERPDENTIIFKLQSPFAPFPSVVAQPTFKKGLLGTGEWRVVKASVAGSFVQRLTLENKSGERTILKFYPTEERAKLAYKLGSVQILKDIYTQTPFDSWKIVRVEENLKRDRVVAVFFNVQDKLMGEKTFRQALAYAIDKDKFPGERAYGPLSEDSWAYNPQVKPYAYDQARARDFLEELPDELQENLSVKLVTTPVLLETAESIVKDWEAVGVKTELQVSSGVPTEYQAFLAIYDIPKDPDQYAIWHSTQINSNISKYQNPRIDKLLEDGRGELAQTERRKIYLDFQRFLVEDSPAIFLYRPVSYTIIRN